ncbi:hypothetical protein H257_15414 [Aphanomyces astaci]|uniref:Uncharacterized protein n=1 Tax=Aphanomyces astaci TaxID=112090 RepID=W4FNU6_APHAT|nr:hypothetical protein H257_15414 [Aphanomyces astaci]ETV68601.1 hypothetical protein H257_15414 [Aphanomyces astaci]|eukprot:XP_009841826.1 hypothetical protein H257_15414 [Aphanomyces astaci]
MRGKRGKNVTNTDRNATLHRLLALVTPRELRGQTAPEFRRLLDDDDDPDDVEIDLDELFGAVHL